MSGKKVYGEKNVVGEKTSEKRRSVKKDVCGKSVMFGCEK